uniref:Coiled-coil domain-containing protein 22 n=1 Tax=Xiphophorus couchianus TaxID=32473 RepID=A0A3B5L6H8_9TELE
MEEVDKILIHALRQVGTEVGEDVDRLNQFTSELIVEAVVRCIRVIDPALGEGLPTSLPPGMSARFRVGMSLAQACQKTYSNIRILYHTTSLLLFLAVSWVPLNCRLPLHCETQVSSHSFHVRPLSSPHCTNGQKYLKEVKDYQRDFLLPVTAQLPSQTSMVSSILEQHTADLSSAQEWDTEWKSQGLLSRLTPQEYRSRKLTRLRKRIEEQLRSAAAPSPESVFGVPRSASELSDLLHTFRGSTPSDLILTKGSHFTHTQKFTFTQVSASGRVDGALQNGFSANCALLPQEAAAVPSPVHTGRQSEGDAQLRQQEELAALQQQFQQLCSDVDLMVVFDELKQREMENTKNEEKTQVKKKTIDLLPDADNNLQKLQSQVEASANRVVNLASQWEKHRAPLIEEHRRLKEICSTKDLESSTKLSEINSLHDKICAATAEAKKKEESYKQLVTELESLPQDVSRSAYTQRILEIVGNIKKQKEEITKILSDTKELQKEINSLTGKLDRTFAVTDELVFKDAKKDESVRKSYKYLAALHENCNQLIQTIEDTGTILREIRDLEEQIETENCNKTVTNLERIMDDYKAIRQENSALAAKVREG